MNASHTPLIVDMLRQSMGQGETPYLTITSESMAPLLKTGDQVGIETVTTSQIQSGDIITITTKTSLLTHRFWILENGKMKTRGDRPLHFDQPWSPDDLLGRVITRRRNGRMLSLTSGSGKKLNQHLAWLILAERRFLNRKRLIRIIHRRNFIWASLIVFITEKLAS